MSKIIQVLSEDLDSGICLALRADGNYAVGICLREGNLHVPHENLDFYVGKNRNEAEETFRRVNAAHVEGPEAPEPPQSPVDN